VNRLATILSRKQPTPRRRSDEDDDEEGIDLLTLLGAGNGSMLDPTYPILRIRGEFNDTMAKNFARAISALDKRGSEIALLDISSPGGDVFALFQMLNVMSSVEIAFSTYNSSHAYSCGALLLAAGQKGLRFAAPLSSTMIHPMSTGISHQQIEDVVAQSQHDIAINDMFLNHLAKSMGISRAKLTKLMTKTSGGGAATLWMSPEQALEVGIIDQIGIPAFSTESKVTVFATPTPKKGEKE